MLKIVRSGLYTSVQDGGRYGYVNPASVAAVRWINRRLSPRICWWGTSLRPRRLKLRLGN